MLSCKEIISSLVKLGFIIDDTPVRITILEHPNINEARYLKKNNSSPLVIHSQNKDQLQQLLTISGVHTGLDKVEYFNSNIKTLDQNKYRSNQYLFWDLVWF